MARRGGACFSRCFRATCHAGLSSCFGAATCNPLEDVLDFLWASDHNDLLAVLQRTQMQLVYTGGQDASLSCRMDFKASTEPTKGPLYLIEFTSLCAKVLCLNSLLQGPPDAAGQQIIVSYDAQPLIQMRQLVQVRRRGSDDPGTLAGLQQAAALASRLNHPTLWRLLADAALQTEELDVTEEALVRCAIPTQQQLYCSGL